MGQLSIHFSSNRGIATPVCGLVRNDRFFWERSDKHQFVGLLSYADKHILLFGVESIYNAVPEAGGEELAKKVQELIH